MPQNLFFLVKKIYCFYFFFKVIFTIAFFCTIFLFFYSQRWVAEPGATPSPWSIVWKLLIDLWGTKNTNGCSCTVLELLCCAKIFNIFLLTMPKLWTIIEPTYLPTWLSCNLAFRTQIFSWKTQDFGPFEYRNKERKILPKLTTYTIHTGTQFPGYPGCGWQAVLGEENVC